VTLPYQDDYNYRASMGFPFTFGDRTFTDVMINSNGHAHFEYHKVARWHVAANGFVFPSVRSIAPFQADVNNAVTGRIRYKMVDGTKFAVVWEEVAHYNGSPDLTNTFELVLSADGSGDPKICFCYDQMEWALDGNTPRMSGEIGISVGAGKGFLLGEFSQTDATWNGIGSVNNGVGYLPGRSFCFNPEIVDSPDPSTELISTFVPGTGGDPHCKSLDPNPSTWKLDWKIVWN